MTTTLNKPMDQLALPELRVSAAMRAAATSVAMSFHAYQRACYALPAARKSGTIAQNLKSQRETKQAYHLALKFLSTATLKENPSYDANRYDTLNADDRSQLSDLLNPYLDKKLNELISIHVAQTPDITHQFHEHPVMVGPW